VSPTTAQHVRDDLGDGVDMILDGGACTVGIESTVLSLALPVPTVLRPGGISVEQLGEVLEEVRVLGGSDPGVASSPGRQERHYSPRARAIAFSAERHGAQAGREGIAVMLVSSESLEAPAIEATTVRMPGDPRRYAAHFYRMLRELDRPSVREIWIELPPRTADWLAVRDRILRAATEAL
jgi:L-threonylcarbamoyladenylate synthase